MHHIIQHKHESSIIADTFFSQIYACLKYSFCATIVAHFKADLYDPLFEVKRCRRIGVQ